MILIIFYILSGIIFWGDHHYMLIITLVTSWVASYLIFKKSKNQKLDYILLNVPFFALLLLTCLIGNNFSRGLPYLIFTPLASLLGLLSSTISKKIISLVSITLLIVFAYYFQINYFSFNQNKNSEINSQFPKVQLIDKNKKPFIIHPNKLIVLDFWTINCTICFEKFPELEKLYLNYQNNPNIEIYSLNVPLKNDDFNKTTKILDNIGYSFPKIYAKSAIEINDSLKIHSFPHLLIIKNGIIRYDGMLETDKDVLLFNTKDEIERLLNE